MNRLPRYININSMTAKSGRKLLHLALPQGQVSIGLKDSQYGQIMMKAIINGSR
jgi:hypothetical protein